MENREESIHVDTGAQKVQAVAKISSQIA